MSESLIYFLLGLLATIPLSIVGALLTLPIQRWMDKRTANLSTRRKQQLKEEYLKIKEYHDDTPLYHTYLLTIVLRLTFIPAVAGLFSAMVFILAGLFQTYLQFNQNVGGSFGFGLAQALYTIGQVISTIGTIMILVIASRALRIISRVRRFSDFEKSVTQALGGQLPQPDLPAT